MADNRLDLRIDPQQHRQWRDVYTATYDEHRLPFTIWLKAIIQTMINERHEPQPESRNP